MEETSRWNQIGKDGHWLWTRIVSGRWTCGSLNYDFSNFFTTSRRLTCQTSWCQILESIFFISHQDILLKKIRTLRENFINNQSISISIKRISQFWFKLLKDSVFLNLSYSLSIYQVFFKRYYSRQTTLQFFRVCVGKYLILSTLGYFFSPLSSTAVTPSSS